MPRVDDEQVRNAWLRATTAEGRAWLAHIDARADQITQAQQRSKTLPFETAELLFHVCAYLNWLAHVYFREPNRVSESGHKRGHDMVTWLHQVTNWPLEACEAFWYCVRNPVMHTGRAWLFADHDRRMKSGLKTFADLHPNLTFDPLAFQPDEFKPTIETDGWMAIPMSLTMVYRGSPVPPGAADQIVGVQIYFYFPGVRRKLDHALEIVVSSIATADHNFLMGLAAINRKTLAFRFSMEAPEVGEGSTAQ